MNDKTFGARYEVIEKIASGGMADVYLALDNVLGRRVAVKTLHPQYAQEENFVARFKREAQAAANLNHPNIVNVYDWGAEGSTYYLVMEYLVGKTLKEKIVQEAPFGEAQVIDIGRKMASALAFAHRKGIVHRDIKPQNIMITDDGAVKVADFGIARSMTSTMTQTGSIMGTAQYLSPEQAQGGNVDSASDIYSLGIVLYEMATGTVPFTGESAVAVALKHVHEAPKAPRLVNPQISESLNATIMRTIAKHPSDRYFAAEDLDKDLARCAQGLPVSDIQPGGEETLIIPRPQSPFKEPEEVPRNRQGEKQRPKWLVPAIIGGLLAVAALVAAILYFTAARVEMVEVPKLTEMTVDQAKDLAKKSKVKLTVGERVYDSATPGTVVGQTPEPGKEVAAGTQVYVKVSKGPRKYVVPGVVDRSLDQATYLIAKADLEVGNITREYSSRYDQGIVMSQNPPARDRVLKGTAIDLVVSKGPAPIHVPDVQNKTEAEASAALTQLGLSMSKSEEYSDTVDAGRVIRTVPGAGVTVERGDTVNAVISKGAELFTVPDVGGLSESAARAKLIDAGFTVQVKQGVSSPKDFGKVVNQDPPAGTKEKKGTLVTIWMGQKPSAED